MNLIRVLIVDDSAVVRKILRDHLDRSPSFEVVDVARNGMDALAKIEADQTGPQRIDAVILDDVMPVMTGKEMLKAIRGKYPRLSVVLFSANVGEGVEGTMDALFHGADDALKKPSKAAGGMTPVLRELDQKLRAAVLRHKESTPTGPAVPEKQGPPPARPTVRVGTVIPGGATITGGPAPAPPTRPAQPVSRRGKKFLAMVIGSSTGGPEALSRVLADLPGDLSVPVFVAQHMPAEFTGRLAARLDKLSALTVKEAQAGDKPRAGVVYIAPGDYHLVIKASGASFQLALNQGPKVHSCRPAADVLFQSACEAYRASLLCTVLTGMGSDGLAGARMISEAGGHVLVQDEETSVVWGMPGYIAREGLADAVLPIDRIGAEMTSLVGSTGGPIGSVNTTTARAVSSCP